MRENYLLVMRAAAEECFDIANFSTSDTYVPHHELLSVLSRLFQVTTIRFPEGYDSFITNLSQKNEALDSWCKLVGVFISRLGDDYAQPMTTAFKDLFKEFACISPLLKAHFFYEGQVDASRVLAYLLCLVSSTQVGEHYVK